MSRYPFFLFFRLCGSRVLRSCFPTVCVFLGHTAPHKECLCVCVSVCAPLVNHTETKKQEKEQRMRERGVPIAECSQLVPTVNGVTRAGYTAPASNTCEGKTSLPPCWNALAYLPTLTPSHPSTPPSPPRCPDPPLLPLSPSVSVVGAEAAVHLSSALPLTSCLSFLFSPFSFFLYFFTCFCFTFYSSCILSLSSRPPLSHLQPHQTFRPQYRGMLTNPLESPVTMSMDGTVGNMEPTMVRMLSVRLVPRASYVARGARDASAPAPAAAVKGAVSMDVPYSLTMRDVACALVRETSAPPTAAMRVRGWFGMSAPRTESADAEAARAAAVQLYVEERTGDGDVELAAVPPLTLVEALVPHAEDTHAPLDPELTMYYARENTFGEGEEILCLACCALCACCVACCAAGAVANANNNKNKPQPQPQAHTNNTYTTNNYNQGGNYPSEQPSGYNNAYQANGGQQSGGYAPNNYGLPPNTNNQPYGNQPQYGNQQPQYGNQQPQYGNQQPVYGQPVYGQPAYGQSNYTPNTTGQTQNYTQAAPL